MRILLTTSFYPPYHVGGACTHSQYLAEALVKQGHEVHVFTSMDAYNFKRKEKRQEIDTKGVIVHRIKSPLGILEPILNYTLGTQPYTYKKFKELIEKEKFDVVHHHNISLLGYKILKKIGHYKNIYTAHDYWLVCPKYDRFKFGKVCEERKNCVACCLMHKHPYPVWFNSKKFKEILEDIDTIIAPSNYMANNLKKYLKKNIKVIYNLIPEPVNVKSQNKYKDYFIFVGQLEIHKGVLELIRVFKQLDKQLLIVGTGSLDTIIKSEIKSHKNIELLGWKSQEEFFPLVKNANALILPSTCSENLPSVIIEAYSLGTPAIGTQLGGIPELIDKVDRNLIFDYKHFNNLNKIIINFTNKRYNKTEIKNIFQKYFSENQFLKNYGAILR